MQRKLRWAGILVIAGLSWHGCVVPQAPPDLLAPTEAQMKIRSLQTRTFDLTDRNAAIRGVITSLQDLGFIIERANEGLGLVTAARFAEPNYYDVLTISVTVRQETADKMSIRANAIYNNKPIEDPKVYQNFFTALQRALFLSQESKPSS
ncbi:MAG: hypothetical protein A4E19_18390 [Nitrospira sp. SG-bin1]|nr:MAG: hypothetical protein A4E19_18390 [Nitrospira sp. SG-bin1]